MNKVQKIILYVPAILAVIACQQIAATPADELAPYYGTPQPAKIIIGDMAHDSKVGSTMWVYIDENGDQYMENGDAFAVITPIEPVRTTSPLSLTLKLPIPIDPTDLWYRLFEVSDLEKTYNPDGQSARWDPPLQDQIFPPFLHEQELTFSVTPGTYVLEVWAGWGGTKPHVTMRASYGFLIEVQE